MSASGIKTGTSPLLRPPTRSLRGALGFLTFLMLPLSARAGTPSPHPLKIAVMDLKSKGGADQGTVSVVSDLVAGKVRALHLGTVLSGEDIRTMLEFEKIQTAFECDKVSCIVEMGGALGVDLVVGGVVGKLGNAYVLTLQLVDTDHARVVAGAQKTLEGPVEGFINVVQAAVTDLFSGIAPKGPHGPAMTAPESKTVPVEPARTSRPAITEEHRRHWIGFLAPGVARIERYTRTAVQGEAVDLQLGLAGDETLWSIDLTLGQAASADEITLLAPVLAGLAVRHAFSWAYVYGAVVGGYAAVKDTKRSFSPAALVPSAGLDVRVGRSLTLGPSGSYEVLLFNDGNMAIPTLSLRWGWEF